MGNPNLGEIRGILLGVENTNAVGNACGEIWVNELRLSSIDEKGGWAALGRVDVTLPTLEPSRSQQIHIPKVLEHWNKVSMNVQG